MPAICSNRLRSSATSFSSSSSRVCNSFSRRPKSLARRPMSRSRCSTASAFRSSPLSRSMSRRSSFSTVDRRLRRSCSAVSRSRITSSLPVTTALFRIVSTSRSASDTMRLAVSSAEDLAADWRSSSARCPAVIPNLRPRMKKAGEAMTNTPSAARIAILFIDLCSTAANAGTGKPPLDPRSADLRSTLEGAPA